MARTFYNPYERDPVSVEDQITGGTKVIKAFNLDLSDLQASSTIRPFSIVGDKGSEFILEIKNEDSYYYNFTTNAFQAAQSRLEDTLSTLSYDGSIKFPTITDDDHYDIYLYAKPGTIHAPYTEVRFADSSIDINSSKGSNSLLMQKVIYQYTDLTLTIGKASPNSTIEMTGTGHSNDSITIERGGKIKKVPFSIISVVTTASKAYQIIKNPETSDIYAKKDVTISREPEILPGEDEFPTATAAFTGDDVNGAVTTGSVVTMDNTDLSAVINVGDKITAPTTNGTVNGAVADGDTVTLDETAATVAAVGDKVTGPGCPFCDSSPNITGCQVINVTGNRVTIAAATAWLDNQIVTFSSKVNRSHTTVTVVETGSTATDFTMSQAIQFRDNQPLTFTPRANFQWSLDNIDRIERGMKVLPSANILADTVVSDYEDSIILFEGTDEERKVVKNKAAFKDTKNAKPTIVKGIVTTQTGNIVFNKQQAYTDATRSISIGAYGERNILGVSDYDLRITDLSIELEPIKTTTSSAVSANTTIPVTSVNGILPNVSKMSGIGIDASKIDPTITARSETSGSGELTASAAQTLESGQEFTFSNAGQKATIRGNIEVLKSGTSDLTIYLDIEKVLSIT